jgi:acetyl-CoA carboxylase carboxyltransferase component
MNETDARAAAEKAARQWSKEQEALLAQRYEQELMNPNEALSLGSISQIVMPSDLRKVLTENLTFHLNHYQPEPLNAVQREFF